MTFTLTGLSQEQNQVLEQIGGWLADQGFYLAGDTALAYFDDAEGDPEPALLEKVSWKKINKDTLLWVKETTRASVNR